MTARCADGLEGYANLGGIIRTYYERARQKDDDSLGRTPVRDNEMGLRLMRML